MDHIEQRIIDLIDQNADKIIAFGSDIWHHAEPGFQEFRTSAKFAEAMESLGMTCQTGIGITGVKTFLKEKTEGEVRIALMGELDALPVPNHPDANPENGAAHCCGHDAQITAVMGAALALTDPEIKAALGGNIAFIGVPCEEAGAFPEIKARLMEEGKISSVGGKCEFIRHGAMDDIDMTVGHHVANSIGNEDGSKYVVYNGGSTSSMDKYATYYGVSMHPAAAYAATDALSAARLAMDAVDMQRASLSRLDVFEPTLLHGYIAKGGDALNVISDKVELKYNFRATSLKKLLDIAYRVDRSLKAGAVGTGAGLKVQTVPGFLPMIPLKDASLVNEIFDLVDPEHKHPVINVTPESHNMTSDYGDLSNIMPVLQFHTAGHRGLGHQVGFEIGDPYEYYVVPAKCFALLAYRLLRDNAACAKQMIAENPRTMTSKDYVALVDSLKRTDTIEQVPVPENLG